MRQLRVKAMIAVGPAALVMPTHDCVFVFSNAGRGEAGGDSTAVQCSAAQ